MQRANVSTMAELEREARDLERKVYDLERQLALRLCCKKPDGPGGD